MVFKSYQTIFPNSDERTNEYFDVPLEKGDYEKGDKVNSEKETNSKQEVQSKKTSEFESQGISI